MKPFNDRQRQQEVPEGALMHNDAASFRHYPHPDRSSTVRSTRRGLTLGELLAGPSPEEASESGRSRRFDNGRRQDPGSPQRLLQACLHHNAAQALLLRLKKTSLIFGADDSRVPKAWRGIFMPSRVRQSLGVFL